MRTQMVKLDFQKTPDEIVNYLKNKGLKSTFSYKELQKEAHDKAFTVAKVMRTDLLSDIHESLLDSLKTGKNFEAWKKSIIPTLEKKGWWGTQEIVSNQGEVKTVVINSNRLKKIYTINTRVAYQKQRYKEMMKLPLSTYWMYRCSFLENSRESHKAMHGTVLHRDHEFWEENYPPNDYICFCGVTAHSESDLKRRGITPTQGQVQSIASKDWAYNVGKNTNLLELKKINLDDSLNNLPILNKVKDESLKNLDFNGLKNKFYQALAIKEGDIFIDKTNDPITITDDFFKSLDYIKVRNKGRELYIIELANVLKDPDEIFLQFEALKNKSDKYVDENSRVVKKFMKYYKTEAGAKRALIVLVEYLKDKTTGVSAYVIDSQGAVETKRVEKLIYKKD